MSHAHLLFGRAQALHQRHDDPGFPIPNWVPESLVEPPVAFPQESYHLQCQRSVPFSPARRARRSPAWRVWPDRFGTWRPSADRSWRSHDVCGGPASALSGASRSGQCVSDLHSGRRPSPAVPQTDGLSAGWICPRARSAPQSEENCCPSCALSRTCSADNARR